MEEPEEVPDESVVEPEVEPEPEEPAWVSTCDFQDEAWAENSDCWVDITNYVGLVFVIGGIGLAGVVIVIAIVASVV